MTSDFGLNWELGVLLGYLPEEKDTPDGDGKEVSPPDYCNTWSAIGPLIEKHEIGIEFIDGFGWTASEPHTEHGNTVSDYDNPRRAAVKCLIQLLEAGS